MSDIETALAEIAHATDFPQPSPIGGGPKATVSCQSLCLVTEEIIALRKRVADLETLARALLHIGKDEK